MSQRKRRLSYGPSLAEGHTWSIDNEQTLENIATASTGTEQVASLENEQILWETIREEHFGVVEQLPLAIHRQLSLMRELDERTQYYSEALLPLLKGYADERLMAAQAVIKSLRELAHTVERHPSLGSNHASLSHIIQLSDDFARTSEEKVNIALAINNIVERHMRLLDHAIHEQEIQLSLEVRPGTSTLSIHLPDLVVPRWSRPSRSSLSPVGNAGADPDAFLSTGDLAMVSSPIPLHSSSASTLPHLPQERSRKFRASTRVVGKGDQARTTTSKTLQLTFRGVAAGPPFTLTSEDFVIDPSERLYCYCREVSFGEMIACDSAKCEREWFHLECVGLEEPPKGKWFCDECSASRKSKKK
ncbi:hypothetical protein AX17_003479 [Amanita inopinata Kibby_2008]|nr:hypothetical protein AX17_003479 [Amanita inopinata Kibby_2008]